MLIILLSTVQRLMFLSSLVYAPQFFNGSQDQLSPTVMQLGLGLGLSGTPQGILP